MAINAENMKIESCYVGRCYYVESIMWGKYHLYGNYCPETREFYLHRLTEDGEDKVFASGLFKQYGNWVDQSEKGYNYEVVRELLQLGYLTSKTLAAFIEAGGEVWWKQ